MLSEKEQVSDTVAFWKFIKQHYKLLLIYSLAGGICASVITGFIPKEYKSYGLVYPPSSTSIENSIDYPNFGYDVEADRLMQIFESREIRDSVIKQYNLISYFEIERSAPEWHDELLKQYFKNIKLERTTSMAVIITARTKSPELSAAIVNYIINAVDNFREKIYKKNIITAFNSVMLEYDTQKAAVDSAETVLVEHLKENNLSSLLMLVSDAQFSIDMEKLNIHNVSAANKTIGSEIIAFKSMYEMLKETRSRMIRIRKTYTNPIPKIYVINYAEPYYKKVSPSYLVNTGIGVLLALCTATIFLLFKNNSEYH